MDPVDGPTGTKGGADKPRPPLRRHRQLAGQFVLRDRPFGRGITALVRKPRIQRVQTKAMAFHFHGPNGFLESLSESSANAHGFAHTLHLSGQRFVGLREFFERPSRHLDHAVIDRRLPTRRGSPGHVIAQLIERVSHGKFGRDFGDGESSGLGRQGRRAADARVHLDHQHFGGLWVHAELHVRAASVHAHFAQDGKCGISHALIFAVGQCLDWGHRDGITGVHPHGINILNAAHNDAVVPSVPHHFEFVFLPAKHRLVDLHLADHGSRQAASHDVLELGLVPRNPPTKSTQGERRTDDQRKANFVQERLGFRHGFHGAGFGQLQAQLFDDFPEGLSIFGPVDDLAISADHFDVEFRQHALVVQLAGTVQCGLPTQGGKQGINGGATFLFQFQHLADAGHRNWLDVRAVGKTWIGHDGGGIGIHQHHAVALFTQTLAGLRAGVVEFTTLANDNGPRPNDQDVLDVFAFWQRSSSSTARPQGKLGEEYPF